MTHQPLTKAEREELRHISSSGWTGVVDVPALMTRVARLLADLDAAEAERDAAQEQVDLDIAEFRRILAEMDNLRVRIPTTPEGGRVLYDLVQGIVLRATNAGRQRVPLISQRDRAEAERDDYRERLADARQKIIAMEEQAMVDEDGMSMRPFDERLRKVEAERDALKAKLSTVSEIVVDLQGKLETYKAGSLEIEAQRDRAESELDAERRMRVEAEAAAKRAEEDRDAHATDLVDERDEMRAERDALKAKLAALVEAADPFACDQGCDAVHHPVKDRHDQRDNCPVVARLRAAIAAARGGAQ